MRRGARSVDWRGQDNYPREVAEMALAHAINDKAEAACRRGDLFKKRQRLMVEWGRYCGSSATKWTNNVAPLRAVKSR